MTLAAILYNEHQIIKLVHTAISMAFFLVAVWLFFRALRGFLQNLDYTRLDRILSYAFIVNLYLQLIFGFFLMAYPEVVTGQELVNQEITMKMASKRFWPVEHIVLMLFALFIANLGLIFSNSATHARDKHRKVLIYYAIAVTMIALSLGSTYFI